MAIVTGASAGIGSAIAAKLVENGMIVAGLARRKEKIEELKKNLGANKGNLHAIKCDVGNENDILSAFKWITANLGPVHVLVNNAGIILSTTLSDGDTESWRNVIDTNVLGVLICAREAIKIMKSKNIAGHIINMNSILGHTIPNAFVEANIYPATKHAVTGLTESLRLELATKDSPIRVTSISPGATETELSKSSAELLDGVFVEDKMLQPEDIADAVVYVISTPTRVTIKELIIKPTTEKF